MMFIHYSPINVYNESYCVAIINYTENETITAEGTNTLLIGNTPTVSLQAMSYTRNILEFNLDIGRWWNTLFEVKHRDFIELLWTIPRHTPIIRVCGPDQFRMTVKDWEGTDISQATCVMPVTGY